MFVHQCLHAMRCLGGTPLAGNDWNMTADLHVLSLRVVAGEVAHRAVPQILPHSLRLPGLRYVSHLLRFIIIDTVLLQWPEETTTTCLMVITKQSLAL